MVVHDHPGVRKGLAMFFGHEPDMEVVSATTLDEHILVAVAELHPDLVLMQRSWGGLDAARLLIDAHPETRVAIVSASTDAQFRAEAAQSGAVGVVDLTAPPSETTIMLRALVGAADFSTRSTGPAG
jgi:two-component system response regulator DegU